MLRPGRRRSEVRSALEQKEQQAGSIDGYTLSGDELGWDRVWLNAHGIQRPASPVSATSRSAWMRDLFDVAIALVNGGAPQTLPFGW